jgi:hypothetical protein
MISRADLMNAFDAVSLYIERHTSLVCPSCKNICCINKHGNYDDSDEIFIRALGLGSLEQLYDRMDTEPCRYLQSSGCSLPRYRRPFRCTWYFCEGLLSSMQDDPPREYRAFIRNLENLRLLRQEILNPPVV